MSTGRPKRWTGITRGCVGVSAASTISAVISAVSGSTSTRTGVAPTALTASAVAMKELVGTMTSSPGPMPSARSASSSASVPEETPTACSVPQYSAKLPRSAPPRGRG